MYIHNIYVRLHMYTYIVCMYHIVYIRIHTYIQTDRQTDIQTYIHIYIHIYILLLPLVRLSSFTITGMQTIVVMRAIVTIVFIHQ